MQTVSFKSANIHSENEESYLDLELKIVDNRGGEFILSVPNLRAMDLVVECIDTSTGISCCGNLIHTSPVYKRRVTFNDYEQYTIREINRNTSFQFNRGGISE